MIRFTQVSKSFGTQEVLANVSFTVNPGERAGFVGPNGAGKSTIFELITGRMSPDRGDVSVPGSVTFGYVRQQLNAHTTTESLIDYTENALPEVRRLESRIHEIEHELPDLSEADRAGLLRELGELQTRYEHLGGYDLRVRAEAALCGLGFSPAALERPFRSFSGGWQIRAELARNLVARPDILLLDEPTNYLDVPAVEWLQDYLRSFSGTLLLISHDRYLLNTLTQVTFEVAGCAVSRYPGNYLHYVEARESRHRQMRAAKANLDRRREQLERFVDRFRAKATKASQAQSRMKMLDKLEDIEVPPDIVIRPPKIVLPKPPRSGTEVVRADNLFFAYKGSDWVLRDVSLRLERGDRAAVVGLNGMGKTTLLRLIAGKLTPGRGRLVTGHNVEIGYQSQDFTDVMAPDRSVYETARAGAVDRSDGDVRGLLGGFGFPGDAIEKKVQVLSGGEKVRLGLACLLLKPCNFLLLDEPTTHLDIGAREALEEGLAEYEGTVCIVSHDIQFVRRVANTIFEIGPEGVTRYYGGYDYYREKKAEAKAASRPAPTPAAAADEDRPAESRDERRDRKREEARLRQEFARVRKPFEARIAEAEDRIAVLEEEKAAVVADLSSGVPNLDFAALNKRLSTLDAELSRVTESWEEASLELESLREEYGVE